MRSKFVFVFLALICFVLSAEATPPARRPAARAPTRAPARPAQPPLNTAGLSEEDTRIVYEERNFPGCLEQTEGSQVAARARALLQQINPTIYRPRAPATRAGARQ